jgi:uncharacterized protein YjbI with pentapeptide repeats
VTREAIFIESREFLRFPPQEWEYANFRFCTFENFSIEGHTVDGALLWSTLRRIDWYDGLFTTATIAHTQFERCVFRGTSFRSTQFIECKFTGCRFTHDNLHGFCVFDDCILAECTFQDCAFEHPPPNRDPLFTRTRFYGCTQSGTTGLDEYFEPSL